MKHARRIEAQHERGRHAGAPRLLLADPKHPDDAFLLQEIANDRRGERALIGKTLIALAIAAILVTVRQLFFV
jgi:hypothetical protein